MSVEKIDEDFHYRYTQKCLYCKEIDDEDFKKTKINDLDITRNYYYCKRHKTYVNPEYICTEYEEE
jgi:hypothetical protein